MSRILHLLLQLAVIAATVPLAAQSLKELIITRQLSFSPGMAAITAFAAAIIALILWGLFTTTLVTMLLMILTSGLIVVGFVLVLMPIVSRPLPFSSDGIINALEPLRLGLLVVALFGLLIVTLVGFVARQRHLDR